MESERLITVINQIGVDTQNEVVKKKRLRVDNSPYGNLIGSKKNMFKNHPYRWQLLVLWNILMLQH
jgi:hypothetical protein